MTKRRMTITTLLAVIAVLLGLNLLVRGSPSSEAQTEEGPVTRRVVGGAVDEPSGGVTGVYPLASCSLVVGRYNQRFSGPPSRRPAG